MRVVDLVRSTGGFTRPDKGKRFVAVQFRITNVSDKAYEDTPSNGAKVIDGIGQQFDSNSGDLLPQKISAGPLLPSMVKLPKGGQALGFVPFSVPSRANVAKVQFGLDSGFSQTGEWVVG